MTRKEIAELKDDAKAWGLYADVYDKGYLDGYKVGQRDGYAQGKRDAVVCGEWGPAYFTDDGLLLRDCTNCGRAHTALSNFCPNCGAQMDAQEGENHETDPV